MTDAQEPLTPWDIEQSWDTDKSHYVAQGFNIEIPDPLPVDHNTIGSALSMAFGSNVQISTVKDELQQPHLYAPVWLFTSSFEARDLLTGYDTNTRTVRIPIPPIVFKYNTEESKMVPLTRFHACLTKLCEYVHLVVNGIDKHKARHPGIVNMTSDPIRRIAINWFDYHFNTATKEMCYTFEIALAPDEYMARQQYQPPQYAADNVAHDTSCVPVQQYDGYEQQHMPLPRPQRPAREYDASSPWSRFKHSVWEKIDAFAEWIDDLPHPIPFAPLGNIEDVQMAIEPAYGRDGGPEMFPPTYEMAEVRVDKMGECVEPVERVESVETYSPTPDPTTELLKEEVPNSAVEMPAEAKLVDDSSATVQE